MQTSSRPTPASGNSSKIVFVAGATGQTGKRIVKELLGQGFEVRAGVRDIEKAKQSIPSSDNLEFVSFFSITVKAVQSAEVLSIMRSICIRIQYDNCKLEQGQ